MKVHDRDRTHQRTFLGYGCTLLLGLVMATGSEAAERTMRGTATANFPQAEGSGQALHEVNQTPTLFQRSGSVSIGEQPGDLEVHGKAWQAGEVIAYTGTFTVTYPNGSLGGTIAGQVRPQGVEWVEEGEMTIRRGSGTFEGARGDGSFTGVMVEPFSETGSTDYEVEVKLNLPD